MSTNLSILKLIVTITLLVFCQCLFAQKNAFVSLEEASETIRKESKGKVLSATTNKYNGVKSHRIQVLTKSGRVKVYQVPVYKRDIPQHYGNSKVPNNTSNYRDRKPNNNINNNRNRQPSSNSNINRNKPSKPNSNSTRNLPTKPSSNPNSRSNYNRSSYNRSNTPVKQPSYSSGETKKK